jgi:hypothetical protein
MARAAMSTTCTTGDSLSTRLARIEAAVATLCTGLRVLSNDLGAALELASGGTGKHQAADAASIRIPVLGLHRSTCTITVDGVPVRLSAREFALMAFLVEECNGSTSALSKQHSAIEPLGKFLKQFIARLDSRSVAREQVGPWMTELLSPSVARETKAESLRKVISRIRHKFKAAGLQSKFSFLLPKPMAFGINTKLEQKA